MPQTPEEYAKNNVLQSNWVIGIYNGADVMKKQ